MSDGEGERRQIRPVVRGRERGPHPDGGNGRLARRSTDVYVFWTNAFVHLKAQSGFAQATPATVDSGYTRRSGLQDETVDSGDTSVWRSHLVTSRTGT